jgi:hypothetical protein
LQIASIAVTANVVPNESSLLTLMMEALLSSGSQFMYELHGVTSQNTEFFIVTAAKTSNLTQH